MANPTRFQDIDFAIDGNQHRSTEVRRGMERLLRRDGGSPSRNPFGLRRAAVRLGQLCLLVAAIAMGMPLRAATDDKATVSEAQVLLTHFKCYLCHADREPKAGPAYVDVAAQYRSTPNAVSVIAAEIRRGLRHGGPWHMPPHPEVSVAEARVMARYIMSLRP